ncbi:DUF4259 domain-containing protein [Trebonia kvetii]|uniref:DUF4259 domain-containing protein n=1 Tax=Trebonia kvetii TaxID=2480626 RepID=A0A6P2BRS3_9ACTN|nr:DUF4259 domain-containing protein [Trebonia kvetii]
MGTWGPGAFDNDDALDLLGLLEGYDMWPCLRANPQ